MCTFEREKWTKRVRLTERGSLKIYETRTENVFLYLILTHHHWPYNNTQYFSRLFVMSVPDASVPKCCCYFCKVLWINALIGKYALEHNLFLLFLLLHISQINILDGDTNDHPNKLMEIFEIAFNCEVFAVAVTIIICRSTSLICNGTGSLKINFYYNA